MYTEQSILFLTDRIGWSKSLNSNFKIRIYDSNLTANSGRTVVSFHQLATVDNIYSNVSEVQISEDKFNQLICDIRGQSVREILTSILDSHHLYDEAIDYSDTIIKRAKIFDDAIGYAIAIKCLELFISSTRSNATERSNAMSFNTLKIELEGAKNDNGHLIASGIVGKKWGAIKKAQKIIFPDKVLIVGENQW